MFSARKKEFAGLVLLYVWSFLWVSIKFGTSEGRACISGRVREPDDFLHLSLFKGVRREVGPSEHGSCAG